MDRLLGLRLVAALTLGIGWIAGSAHVASAQASTVGVADAHVCDDCHGSHRAAPGRGSLVRSGWSVVTPQAPGIGNTSRRCLQCHGTEGDRRQVESDRQTPLSGALLLGASLAGGHPLGTARSTGRPSTLAQWSFSGGNEADPIGLPGFESGAAVECTSCHDPHDSWSVTQQTRLQDDTCLACHDPSLNLNSHGVASCGSCHRLHGAPDRDHLTREPSVDYLCGACHRGATPPLNPGIDPIPASRLHDEPRDMRCQECHKIH